MEGQGDVHYCLGICPHDKSESVLTRYAVKILNVLLQTISTPMEEGKRFERLADLQNTVNRIQNNSRITYSCFICNQTLFVRCCSGSIKSVRVKSRIGTLEWSEESLLLFQRNFRSGPEV